MLIRFLFLFLCIPLTFQAQNIVKNPSFEEYHRLPRKDGQLNGYVKHWNNPNPSVSGWPNASPDYLHTDGQDDAQLPDSYCGKIKPTDGEALIFLVTYNVNAENFREYVTGSLTEPLEEGATYELSFDIRNLYEYGGYGSDRLQVLFSKTTPIQKIHEPLKFSPQVSFDSSLYFEKWSRMSRVFKADGSHTQITIGNFKNDKNTATFRGKNGVDNKIAFYAIDNIVLTKIKPAEQKPVALVDGRDVFIAKDISVTDSNFTIEIWDHQVVDGDVISLQYNGKWVLQNYKLTKKKATVDLSITPTGDNMLILYAHNLGKYPPNTIALRIKGDSSSELHELNADFETSEAIQFVKQP